MQMIVQIYQVCETTLFFWRKKKPTLPEQDINMKTELECRRQEGYNMTISNESRSYCLPFASIPLQHLHLLTTTQTHEKCSSHTHPWNQKECQSQSFALFHHC